MNLTCYNKRIRKAKVQCADSIDRASRMHQAGLTNDKATREENMHFKVTF